MADTDFQVKIQKDGTLRVVDPASKTTIANVDFAGEIMKGCSTSSAFHIQDQNASGTQRRVQSFDTKFSFGNFNSPTFPGILSMMQNPNLKDSGYEVQLVPGQEYPKQQFWSMFGIFTVNLESVNPKFARLQLANREDSPVRLEVTLNQQWGDEPLLYTMMDDEVALYPWDSNTFDFASVCPIYGTSPAKPIAFIEKMRDKTTMTGAWRRVAGVLTKTI